MKAKNDFDCVAMKNEIQRKLREEYAGLSDEEVRERMRRELETSDDIVARKWREVRGAQRDKNRSVA